MELKIPVSVVLFPPRPPFNIVLSIRHRAERPVFRFRYWLGTKEAVRNGSSDSNHAHRPMTARASGFAPAPYAVVFSTFFRATGARACVRSEEHTSELQSLMRISYAVFCLKKKKKPQTRTSIHQI